ncbi:hypothetical protein EHQ47_16830 [Leptospira bourretii]|uniref:hypothetical protein n=1 Tax=Leptospira bourretii TaxID=2484962 RepID=UPI001090CDB3|nr:hypothetical protein [Leptospira bourretii]TGL19761.1 hypothetical protein EHQ47_16830 [Leptospira bourretii]
MTNYTWDEHLSTVKSILNHDKLSTIPLIEYKTEYQNKMHLLLGEEFRTEKNAEIFIIDPYFTSDEFNFLINAFGQHGESYTFHIITKYEFIKGKAKSKFPFMKNKVNKKIVIEETLKISRKITEAGIFKAINIYHSTFQMHDRYLFMNKEKNNNKFFVLGSSINQIFQNYSYIIRINDSHFKNMILNYVTMLLENVKKNN